MGILESFGKRIKGVVLGAIVFLLCAVFVLEFGGPQSEGCAGSSSPAYAAKVHSSTITLGEFRAAYKMAGFDRYPEQVARTSKLREITLNALIERELLAHQARELGFHVSEDDVMREFTTKGAVWRSTSVDAPAQYGQSGSVTLGAVLDEDKLLDEKAARQFIQNYLRRSLKEFSESQVQEALAQKLRELILATALIGPVELQQTHALQQEKVALEYVRFSPNFVQGSASSSAEKLNAWMRKNADLLEKEYAAQKARFTDREPEVHARHILLKLDKGASDEDKANVKAHAERVLKLARQGQDFASLAQQHSEDTATARKGGDLGFNPRGRMVEAFDEAQFKLKPGEISDLVESEYGYHIIKVEDKREGTVPAEQAKRELAEEMVQQEQASGRVKELSEKFHQKVERGASFEDALAQVTPTGSSAKTAEEPGEDPFTPKVKQTEPFAATDTPFYGPFDTRELVAAAFALSEESALAKPLQLGDEWVVFRMTERQRASDRSLSDEEKEQLQRELEVKRGQADLRRYVHTLRDEAEQDRAIEIEPSILDYDREAS